VAERGGPSYPGIMKWRRDGGESASTVEGILGLICVLKEEIRCESGLVEVIRRSSVKWIILDKITDLSIGVYIQVQIQ
jgi:hypothetical protein